MNKYDRVIQENVQQLTLSLVRKMLKINNAEITILPRKMQRTLERETDLIIKVTRQNGREVIYNIEWQSTNYPFMCRRMMLYNAMLHIKYGLPVIGIVVYIGKSAMNMPDAISYNNCNYRYRLIDLSQYNPRKLLQSDIPEEVMLAILTGENTKGTKRLLGRKIIAKLQSLLKHNKEELYRKIVQLEVLAELRDVDKIIIEEENNMLKLDKRKSARYWEGVEDGVEKGVEKGIKRATRERNKAFVIYLLQNTSHSVETIAALVNVTPEFVMRIKDSLSNKTTKMDQGV